MYDADKLHHHEKTNRTVSESAAVRILIHGQSLQLSQFCGMTTLAALSAQQGIAFVMIRRKNPSVVHEQNTALSHRRYAESEFTRFTTFRPAGATWVAS